MSVVIGLGSNLQRPLQQLRIACKKLKAEFTINAYSNIYRSEALVPEGAPKNWHDKAYLNAAVKITTDLSPEAVLAKLKKIEREMGRVSSERWAPRIIDLDILTFGTEQLSSSELTLPHQELAKRAFALLPLWDVWPEYEHPHFPNLTRQEVAKTKGILPLPHLLAGPELVGILNVTPDSFSDGGQYLEPEAATLHAKKLFAEGADIIDIGAESTRPGANLLEINTEWQRLAPVLKALKQHWAGQEHRPLISIDTRHSTIITQALDFDIDWINDVSQEEFFAMAEILKAHPHLKYIAMHHLGVPPQKDKIIREDALKVLLEFKKAWQQKFAECGLTKEQLILDPGLGFGKSVMQQLAIINRLHELGHDQPWLVGHSRKSFLNGLVIEPNAESKETASAIISAHLATQGVSYLRVHAPNSSLAAIRLHKVLLST